jgi:hypothetical protein
MQRSITHDHHPLVQSSFWHNDGETLQYVLRSESSIILTMSDINKSISVAALLWSLAAYKIYLCGYLL